MMDNIIASKLYRAGSVGYVSKSGGMSNELNNILSLVTNGTYEGIAIGGDRYPGTTFIDHLLRYEADPECKMLVLLGEVGGIEEYRVIEAVKKGVIKKPIVAWAIGTCAKMFTTEVQFGHAGSMANSDLETADAKNAAMRRAGFIVPDTFEDLPQVLRETYERLVANGTIVERANGPLAAHRLLQVLLDPPHPLLGCTPLAPFRHYCHWVLVRTQTTRCPCQTSRSVRFDA